MFTRFGALFCRRRRRLEKNLFISIIIIIVNKRNALGSLQRVLSKQSPTTKAQLVRIKSMFLLVSQIQNCLLLYVKRVVCLGFYLLP